MESPERSAARFEIELEFVQALAAPEYLHSLAINAYLEDPRFIRYLQYLRDTWSLSESHSKYVLFPAAHMMLKLLQTPEFRKKCKDPGFISYGRQLLD